ncbi:hypothetical protein PYCCODRAFT_11138 [Trametes coccinea BRFM310]|uniref:Uncharacterized protein n=1 Tax=Trametes coccinea (strain BRFM310) TaxID=1353009 RepID=A0A1Y2J4J0_TRAC3|nr:hypothetical protein PYCCODRAFT_11138 [Trametes coccinea BRFM310]
MPRRTTYGRRVSPFSCLATPLLLCYGLPGTFARISHCTPPIHPSFSCPFSPRYRRSPPSPTRLFLLLLFAQSVFLYFPCYLAAPPPFSLFIPFWSVVPLIPSLVIFSPPAAAAAHTAAVAVTYHSPAQVEAPHAAELVFSPQIHSSSARHSGYVFARDTGPGLQAPVRRTHAREQADSKSISRALRAYAGPLAVPAFTRHRVYPFVTTLRHRSAPGDRWTVICGSVLQLTTYASKLSRVNVGRDEMGGWEVGGWMDGWRWKSTFWRTRLVHLIALWLEGTVLSLSALRKVWLCYRPVGSPARGHPCCCCLARQNVNVCQRLATRRLRFALNAMSFNETCRTSRASAAVPLVTCRHRSGMYLGTDARRRVWPST